jgi:hypothetical protein
MSKLLCRARNNASTLQTKSRHGDDAKEDEDVKAYNKKYQMANI